MTRSGIIVSATLISVVGLGILYVITSLAFVSAYPESSLIEDAQNPAGPFFVAMGEYGNQFFVHVMEVFILTGSFACAMAFHNAAMRYYYAMGREEILPKALGRTHPTHKSPYVASVFQTVIALALVLAWGIGSGFGFGAGFDTAYVRIYTMMAVQGVVWLMAIQTRLRAGRDRLAPAPQAPRLVLGRRRRPRSSPSLGQVFALYLLFANIDVLAGTIGYVDLIKWIAIVGVVVALGYAFWLKRTQPQEVRHDRPDDRRGRDRPLERWLEPRGVRAGLGLELRAL